MAGETYEFTTMYPAMIADAGAEDKPAIRRYFDWVNAVEEVHANLYKKALAAEGKLEDVDYYVCSVCGYTHEGPYAGKCPICNAAESAFYKVA